MLGNGPIRINTGEDAEGPFVAISGLTGAQTTSVLAQYRKSPIPSNTSVGASTGIADLPGRVRIGFTKLTSVDTMTVLVGAWLNGNGISLSQDSTTHS